MLKLYTKPVGPIETNCYIAADDAGVCAVVDPGAQAALLSAFLRENKLTPACILLTHGHFDHIGAVSALAKEFGCEVLIGAEDAQMIAGSCKRLVEMMGGGVAEDFLFTPDRLVHEADVISAGVLHFTVIETPGHTRGSVCYRCEDCLFSGDTLFAGTVGRTDLEGGDYGQIIASVTRLAEIEGDLRVLPGHGDATTLERERRSNRFMRKLSDDDFY